MIFGDAGHDILEGGAENDEIFGGNGDDTIRGGTGNDQLRGDLGADVISGGAGTDEIHGSGGYAAGVSDNDILSGGAGADTFIFELSREENRSGDDRITDFDTTEDRLLLDGDILVQLTDTTQGVLIEQITGGSILVEGVLAIDIRPAIDGLIEIT